MRVALFSDIHGNSIALDAVLADIEEHGGVDATWVLGDLVAIGADPVGVLERLEALLSTTIIRGNTDRYVTTGDRPPPTEPDVRGDPSLFARYTEVQRSFAWTQGMVTAAGWLEWLSALPLDARLLLPDGTRLLGVHASPGTDDGPGFHPGQGDDERAAAVAGCEADLVVVGHRHYPARWSVGGIDVIALGSVSNPLAPDLRASYVVLEADERGYEVEHRRVAYDLDASIAATDDVRHPAAEFINRYFRGEMVPHWRR
ncbi:MAG: metallophosphoesterase family protein [Chloroflexi bacterium]|nr:metallophosphoesterase family protein [Chloroflexota bacterium]MDA1145267.1 metallophosphoesterase family protein [Chloroflexota bacterium]